MSTSIDTTAAPDPADLVSIDENVAEIQRGINALFEPTDIVEVRVPKANANKGTAAGKFQAPRPELAKTLANLSGKHPSIYYTLNPVDPALGQPSNKVKTRASSTTKDGEI